MEDQIGSWSSSVTEPVSHWLMPDVAWPLLTHSQQRAVTYNVGKGSRSLWQCCAGNCVTVTCINISHILMWTMFHLI